MVVQVRGSPDVKPEIYWTPGIGVHGVWVLRTRHPGEASRGVVIGFVETVHSHTRSQQFRGLFYPAGDYRAQPEAEFFDTPEQAQAWVYSLAIMEN
jgi:hypothetical protein